LRDESENPKGDESGFMAEVILGQDIIDNWSYFKYKQLDGIDPLGTNVIQDKWPMGTGFYCVCLVKLENNPEPNKRTFFLDRYMFDKIVLNINLSKLNEVH
jgi:hypothetical protein